ncbi:hypothetical protein NL676_016567 [Syzygium grande]|nr:hypothetical protein NL676_016567 [Syzygium grande]
MSLFSPSKEKARTPFPIRSKVLSPSASLVFLQLGNREPPPPPRRGELADRAAVRNQGRICPRGSAYDLESAP